MLKIAAALLSGSLLLISAAGAETLIKAEEAKLPAHAFIATRAITRGPAVRLLAPSAENSSVASPFTLRIAFEPRGGAKIDVASVRVDYLRNPIIDLLDRVRKGLTEKGIELASAETPPGEHQIRVSVKDNEGRETTSVLTLNVAK